jgi:hypothetical protein
VALAAGPASRSFQQPSRASASAPASRIAWVIDRLNYPVSATGAPASASFQQTVPSGIGGRIFTTD